MSTGPLTVSMAKQAVATRLPSLAAAKLLAWMHSLSTENIDHVEMLLKMSYNIGVADGKEPAQ